MTAPRLLRRAELRAYLDGISDSTLSRWIEGGIVPGPLPGTTFYDRHAVDRALDKLSGLLPESEAMSDDLDRALGLAS